MSTARIQMSAPNANSNNSSITSIKGEITTIYESAKKNLVFKVSALKSINEPIFGIKNNLWE